MQPTSKPTPGNKPDMHSEEFLHSMMRKQLKLSITTTLDKAYDLKPGQASAAADLLGFDKEDQGHTQTSAAVAPD